MHQPDSYPSLACRVITLNPRADNTCKLLSSLRQQGINATLFDAVDGRQGFPPLQTGERLDQRMAMLRRRSHLTATELGCYLSHLRAVREAYDQGYEFVCLLEDDVVIEPGFAAVLAELLPEQLDIVRFMALKLRRRKLVKTLSAGVDLVRPERGTLGTQAYMLSRRGMEKFLAHASHIYEAIDHVLDHFFLFDLDTWLVEPHTAYELAGSSSVSKRETAAAAPGFRESLLYHPVKLWFSARRHLYFWRKRAELYPNQWPVRRPGRSPRLRGKGPECRELLATPGRSGD
ncbi:glycosyltransferase family 25 protein [Pseudomaricurvus sp. HS19]|uniref:glycosyltransferase family 25 protein n=1 Tax=Pseudomaricurvus sp. HS19 TaxID=2692626 RepID=UPI0013712AE8|nr:glycosyltransferase family 25 protein [Pseudomaricurvus sp. HS19]MYM61848.1 hypothetical protein [Pseudomaricurvus sp. HS19]